MMFVHIPKQKVKCRVCEKEFDSLDELVQHFNENHKSISTLESVGENKEKDDMSEWKRIWGSRPKSYVNSVSAPFYRFDEMNPWLEQINAHVDALKQKREEALELIPDICLFGDCDFATMSLTGDAPDNYCYPCPVRKLYLILSQGGEKSNALWI